MCDVVIIFLLALPFAVIGWIGGMIWMRAQYLPRVREWRRFAQRLQRRLEAKGAWWE